MGNLLEQYRSKLVTAKEAVKVVKSGDWVRYGFGSSKPTALDIELAKRRDELFDVKIHCSTCQMNYHVVESDPTTMHFLYNSGQITGQERRLREQGLCYYIASQFGANPDWFRKGYAHSDVAMISVAPMDKFGFFNFSVNNTFLKSLCEVSSKVIVEINPFLPRALGGFEEQIHISEVDMIIEDARAKVPLPEVKPALITHEQSKIAEFIIDEISNGACLQLGIGGIPQAVGEMIAMSDLKDLGVHTEMVNQSIMDMFIAGKITGNRKTLMPGKIVYSFALGTKDLYDWVDNNSALASCPVNFTNSPEYVMKNDNVVSVNNCLQVDLFGQVNSESIGTRMISGAGGQLEFCFGSFYSKGGKSFLAMTSFYDKKGTFVSRIVPTLPTGTIVTTPRPVVHYLVTEQGIINVKAKSEWARAEMIISLAHPDFRDDLVKEAEKLGIWRRTAKLPQ